MSVRDIQVLARAPILVAEPSGPVTRGDTVTFRVTRAPVTTYTNWRYEFVPYVQPTIVRTEINTMLPIVVLSFFVAVGAQENVRTLDLTRPPEMAPKIAPYNIQNCRLGGRGTGQSGGAAPFALAVVSFDKAEYSMGDPIFVDLRLTNISQRSLPIPTVFVDEFSDPFEGEEAIQFGFTILMKDAAGQEYELTGTLLRGSTRFPDTTQSLGPGESIRIHFPGHIPITDSPTAPRTREGQLFASLWINDGECRRWNVVRSKAVGNARFIGR